MFSIFSKLFGSSYDPKNNYSVNQKLKIVKYLYFKNYLDLSKEKIFTYLSVEKKDDKESIEKRIFHLKELKEYNRNTFLLDIHKSHNRIIYTGI